MTVFQLVRRATLLIPSGPAHDLDRKHLFIILTDPVADPFNGGKNSVLLTSLSTLDTALPNDPTCILHPGDHPFVVRDSYVSYRDSRIVETAKIINLETAVEDCSRAQGTESKGFSTAPQFTKKVNSSMTSSG